METLNVKTLQPFSRFIGYRNNLMQIKSNSNFQKIVQLLTVYLQLEFILSKLVQKNYSEVSNKWVGLGLNKRVRVRSQITFTRRGR